MKALALDAEARTANIRDIPQPSPGPNELLIRVHAIGLNPIDPLYVSTPLAASGRTIGSDFAGTIVALPSSPNPNNHLRIGDRVSAFLQGACSTNPRPGAFAEFLVVPWDLIWKFPDSVGVEEAAGVSLVALTAAQGVYYCLGLPAPFFYDREVKWAEHPEWRGFQSREKASGGELKFFVYGASTSVALFAAQFIRLSARASGRTVKLFGAASKSRHELLKQEPYSYDHLVDYRDPDWDHQIRSLAEGEGMDYVYDCISEGSSVERASGLLREGGKSMVVRSRPGGAWTADNLPVEPIYNAVWEGLGEDIEYQGMVLKKSPAAKGFAVAFYEWLGGVLGREVKAVPVRVMPGGLERVVGDGFALLGAGGMGDRDVKREGEWMRPVSGEKLVYRI
ncbi:putative secondary metabolism biosynthetic enzyme [Elasticomyces elasticus]|uniref:Secondary metabolism biosynthetic enzyme n=1 Tax=Elasticomyces elasticus TaxID=574655 RepID=A0AAN7WDF6_9PEZI|nr:putative secondary metabolism biosynthetic enzyme [Elasticomyces elasticus]